jgi:hypothetical protein
MPEGQIEGTVQNVWLDTQLATCSRTALWLGVGNPEANSRRDSGMILESAKRYI